MPNICRQLDFNKNNLHNNIFQTLDQKNSLINRTQISSTSHDIHNTKYGGSKNLNSSEVSRGRSVINNITQIKTINLEDKDKFQPGEPKYNTLKKCITGQVMGNLQNAVQRECQSKFAKNS